MPAALEYTVEAVRSESRFSGKLGKLTHEFLKISRDGHTYDLTILDGYHSAVGPRVKPFAVGDHVRIAAQPDGDQFRVWRRELRRD